MTKASDVDDDFSDDDLPATARSRRHAAKRSGQQSSLLKETVVVVALALVIATLVRVFLVQAFLIPSGSMENTLRVNDRVLVSKLTTRFGEVHRGDVIVFADPDHWLAPQVDNSGSGLRGEVRKGLEFIGLLPNNSQGHLIKRVIGLPGDKVECCDDQGRMTVNGHALDESSYLYPGDVPSAQPFSYTVPKGQLWVMGDHRSDSGDSRINGTVPESKVTGRAFSVIWPFSHWAGLGRPDTFKDVPDHS